MKLTCSLRRLLPVLALAGCAMSTAVSARTACDEATGRVLQVGPGQDYPVPSAAAAVQRDGDVVSIAAGDYRGDVASWTANDLKLCGAGGRARLFADGKHAGGKAIWVITGANVTVDGIEFRGARVPDQNGAGIRAQGTSLTVRNSGFFDNENGILGGDGGTVTIERSEFGRNGHGDGQSHNIYIGFAERLTVTASYFHEAKVGHNLKSRAKENFIEDSYLMDGAAGNSSYLADFPSGGKVVLRGNLFHKGPEAENSTAISFGAEGLKWPASTLELVHNTIVMTRSGGAFVHANGSAQAVTMTANLFAGTGNPALLTGFSAATAERVGNVTASAGQLPGADNLAEPNFWPSASLLPKLLLVAAPDSTYRQDSPKPFVLRQIKPGSRMVGALQSRP